jgi:hypothetical protein
MTAAMALDVKDKKVEVVAASGRFTGKGLGLYRGRSGEALSNGHLVAGATTPKPPSRGPGRVQPIGFS